MHKTGTWYPVSEKPDPEDGDTFALCVSGFRGNEEYDHAVHLDECNYYEDGAWYPSGIADGTLTVHGWYIVPEMESKSSLVHCKDCIYYDDSECDILNNLKFKPDDFCSYGCTKKEMEEDLKSEEEIERARRMA